jgi:hypothetical protein
VATTPYGTLPAPPQVGSGEAVPEHRVGLTQRPLGPMVGRSVMRPTALLTPRSITPRAGVRLRAPRLGSASRSASRPQVTRGMSLTVRCVLGFNFNIGARIHLYLMHIFAEGDDQLV